MFNIKRLLYTSVGKILISIILGLGLASLFRKVCKDKDCMSFRGPIIDDISGRFFQYGDDCYTYKQRAASCDAGKKIVELSSKADREDGTINPILDIPAPTATKDAAKDAANLGNGSVFSFLNGRGGA